MDEEQRKKVAASLAKIDQEIAAIQSVLKKVPADNPIGTFDPPSPPIIFGSICNPKKDDPAARSINTGELKAAITYLDRLNGSIKEVLGKTPAPKPPIK